MQSKQPQSCNNAQDLLLLQEYVHKVAHLQITGGDLYCVTPRNHSVSRDLCTRPQRTTVHTRRHTLLLNTSSSNLKRIAKPSASLQVDGREPISADSQLKLYINGNEAITTTAESKEETMQDVALPNTVLRPGKSREGDGRIKKITTTAE